MIQRNWLIWSTFTLTGIIVWLAFGGQNVNRKCVVGCLDVVDACKRGGKLICKEVGPVPFPDCIGPRKCEAPQPCQEADTVVTISYQCINCTGTDGTHPPQARQFKFKVWYDCDGNGSIDCGCYAAYVCRKPGGPSPCVTDIEE